MHRFNAQRVQSFCRFLYWGVPNVACPYHHALLAFTFLTMNWEHVSGAPQARIAREAIIIIMMVMVTRV
jgi:hypothetical protein